MCIYTMYSYNNLWYVLVCQRALDYWGGIGTLTRVPWLGELISHVQQWLYCWILHVIKPINRGTCVVRNFLWILIVTLQSNKHSYVYRLYYWTLKFWDKKSIQITLAEECNVSFQLCTLEGECEYQLNFSECESLLLPLDMDINTPVMKVLSVHIQSSHGKWWYEKLLYLVK